MPIPQTQFSDLVQDTESGFLLQKDNPIEWQSISGVDMVASFRFDGDGGPVNEVFAELQTVSISATRSIYPVRVLGESMARAYTRGARTFAGSLIFAMFNQDPFERVAKIDAFQEAHNPNEPFFMDQLPEFDIIINGVNEYGRIGRAIIGGVTLTNYGTTLSIHDIYTEISYTYVSKFYIPMTEDLRAVDKAREVLNSQLAAASSYSDQVMRGAAESWVRDPNSLDILDKYPRGTTVGNMIRAGKL